nr:reverse transcriptase domain-containing protein [Tanacetum cinerariifolium]
MRSLNMYNCGLGRKEWNDDDDDVLDVFGLDSSLLRNDTRSFLVKRMNKVFNSWLNQESKKGCFNTANQSKIEGHLSALKELLKELSNCDLIKPMLLDFNDEDEDTDEEIEEITLDGKARAWFDKLHPGSIDNWGGGAAREVPDESNAIPSVPELMQISSSMSSHKCPELSKLFPDSIPKTFDEMLKRVDDYVRSKEAFCDTELPRGEFQRREGSSQWVKKNDRPQKTCTAMLAIGCPSLKQLRAIPSTIYKMMKFPTPWGITMLVSQTAVVFECRRVGKKQAIEPSKQEKPQENTGPTEEVLVNLACLDQLVTIGRNLSLEGSTQLKNLLKNNKDVFAWEPSDMTRAIIRCRWQKRTRKKLPSIRTKGHFTIPKCCLTSRTQGTYQRLVDEAFPSHIGQNLEAYVDDMVVKRTSKREMIADVAKTFDNLIRINMQLNPKKCSFGVEEGKFLGLSGKLAALNRFLSRSAKKSLPLFKTLKDITKENKDDYRWAEDRINAFQELKKMILKLPSLTTPHPKEAFNVYLATSKEAINVVLVAKRKERQYLVHYVSRTMHDVERHYVSLEKIALALLHVSRRLRIYFEAHPIIVITDQPSKQILNKAEASERLAKYYVELGAHNISYEPRSTIKGQILADFINEIPIGSEGIVPRTTPHTIDHQNDCKEEWILYIDGASSIKGLRVGLVLSAQQK